MELCQMKDELSSELKKQGADQSVINWALHWLETPEQIKQMMDYLVSIRDEHIPKGVVIGMIDKISENDGK